MLPKSRFMQAMKRKLLRFEDMWQGNPRTQICPCFHDATVRFLKQNHVMGRGESLSGLTADPKPSRRNDQEWPDITYEPSALVREDRGTSGIPWATIMYECDLGPHCAQSVQNALWGMADEGRVRIYQPALCQPRLYTSFLRM